jgi:hypothetical protein
MSVFLKRKRPLGDISKTFEAFDLLLERDAENDED